MALNSFIRLYQYQYNLLYTEKRKKATGYTPPAFCVICLLMEIAIFLLQEAAFRRLLTYLLSVR